MLRLLYEHNEREQLDWKQFVKLREYKDLLRFWSKFLEMVGDFASHDKQNEW